MRYFVTFSAVALGCLPWHAVLAVDPVVAPVAAADLRAPVTAVLEARCTECHGPKKAKHDLRLDTREGMLKGGKELGPALVPGKPQDSPLYTVTIKEAKEDMAMPPKGKRLTKSETEAIRAWIAAGAP
jgi:mono/diheme cytochrome c family protein